MTNKVDWAAHLQAIETEGISIKDLDSTFKCNTPSPYEVLPWNRPEPTPT